MLFAECEQKFTRRSGPGGQHRNKVETAVILTHRPSGLGAEASETRSQAGNRLVALFRLRLRLAVEMRCLPKASPSILWISRCRGARIAISKDHHDFPGLLAEAIDVLAHCEFNSTEAATQLEISSSQLLRLLRMHPPALELLNTQRLARGKTPLA